MNTPRRYLKWFDEPGMFAIKKSTMRDCAFHVSHNGHDVLATDWKRGRWYYTLHDPPADLVYYGPFASKHAACRALDNHMLRHHGGLEGT